MRGSEAGPGVAAAERPSALRPIGETTSRTDLVASAVREMILGGQFKPGDTLVERHLAELLGVSKTPVREALIALASSGLVQVSRNRGVVVRRPSADDMWKVFELRLLLEPWAIGRATQLRSGDVVPAAAVALDESLLLLDGGDQVRLSLANRRFHRALYSGCGNDLVIRDLDQMQDLISLGFVLLWERSSWPVWREEYEEHRGILAAVEAQDAQAATAAAREHIERAMTLFEQHMHVGG
jgi:DNA-binding GntR family transcriptional regulator